MLPCRGGFSGGFFNYLLPLLTNTVKLLPIGHQESALPVSDLTIHTINTPELAPVRHDHVEATFRRSYSSMLSPPV